MSKPVFEIQKNKMQKIVFSMQEFKGIRYADIRLYHKGEGSEDYVMTKKGLAVPLDKYDEFRKGVERLQTEVNWALKPLPTGKGGRKSR